MTWVSVLPQREPRWRPAAEAPLGSRQPAAPRRAGGLARLLGLALALSALSAGVAAAQQVGGTVTSADDNRALPRVQVTVKGSTTGTVTDESGRYALTARTLNDTLVFTAVGFARREVPIGGRNVVDVTLSTQAVALEGLVVVGYGTQQRRDVTGSVARVQGEEIAQQPTPSVSQALQGRVAGVQVTPASGEPGQPAVVRIRGVGTLGNASPLYVVDGMLIDDINFLNPADIASVEVLKDASATAIYGSRGANGVIIVTTRQGDAGDRTSFSLNAWAGMQSVEKKIDLVNAQQYAQLANELAANLGQPAYFPNPNSLGAGVDWQDAVFQDAPVQNYQVSASGGSDRVRYYFSGNLIRQEGVLPKSEYDRLTFRLNNDYDLSESFRVGHNLNFSYTDDQRAPGVLGGLYRADPTVAPRDENGNFNDLNARSSAGNPAAAIHYTNNGEENQRLIGNLFAEKDFLDDFTFRSSFGLDYVRQDYREFTPQFFVSPTQQNVESDLTVQANTFRSWLWENTVDWNYSADRYRLTALAGVTAQSFYGEDFGGSRINLVCESPSCWYLNAGTATGQTNSNSAREWRMLSYLFRTNYTLLDRYLLTASLRVDGSSRFGSENRYGWFPSVALGWNVHEEAFFAGFRDFMPALKLRGSWGKIGNDKIGEYPGIPLVTGNLNAVFGPDGTLVFGATPINLANPDVRWEETSQTNLGADFQLFGGAVDATLDWYRRTTDGILVDVPIPLYVGAAGRPIVNAAEVRNSGFEASLQWNRSFGDFELDLGVNGATVNNEVLALGQGNQQITHGGLGNEVQFTQRTVVGRPIGSFWGYKVVGVFQNEQELATLPKRGGERPGDLRYADTNGDQKIDEFDKTWLGSPIPDVTYGFNTRLAWRDFDLSAVFSGQAGNEIYNGKKSVRFGVENYETSFLDRWTGPGTSNREPRITNAGHNYQASERFIEDGTYLKLQTAQFGYRLPESLTRVLNVSRARVYVSGTNLFTITDYSGYTPEIANPGVIVGTGGTGIDLGVYPSVRQIIAGIDLSF